MKKVVCCIPLSWTHIPVDFFRSYIQMERYTSGKYDLEMITSKSCYMDIVRDDLAKKALEKDPDYILWLDADQYYPENTIEVLSQDIDKGCLIVGGITPTKGNGTPLVYKFIDDNGLSNFNTDIRVNQGTVRVDAMGFGGIMIHPSVFVKLQAPYFNMYWNREKNISLGEDLMFYSRCKKAGIKVYCNTNLVYGHFDLVNIGFDDKYYHYCDNMTEDTDYWIKDGHNFQPKFDMVCPFCGGSFDKINIKLLDFKTDPNSKPIKLGYAVDNVYRCKQCGYRSMYGLAVTKEHHAQITKEIFNARLVEKK